MPLYLEDDEFTEGHLPGDVAQRSTPSQRHQHVSAASSEADGYLRTAGYTLPLNEWGPDLQTNVGAIAAYRLAVTLGLLPEPAQQSALYLNFKAAIRWLEGVVDGSITPDVAAPGVVPGQGPSIKSDERRGW